MVVGVAYCCSILDGACIVLQILVLGVLVQRKKWVPRLVKFLDIPVILWGFPSIVDS